MTILLPILILAGVGLLAGLILAVASVLMAVPRDEKVEALEFGIKQNYPFVGVPLRDLRIRSGILVAGIVRRSGRIVIPTGDDVINQGDDVIVVATDTEIQDIRDIFQ